MKKVFFTVLLFFVYMPLAFADTISIDKRDFQKVSDVIYDAAYDIRYYSDNIMTEVPSYIGLSEAVNAGSISPRSAMIISYALCGFASIESLSIAVGGAVALAPEKTGLITSICYKSLLAATIATLITGTVAGLFYIG